MFANFSMSRHFVTILRQGNKASRLNKMVINMLVGRRPGWLLVGRVIITFISLLYMYMHIWNQ